MSCWTVAQLYHHDGKGPHLIKHCLKGAEQCPHKGVSVIGLDEPQCVRRVEMVNGKEMFSPCSGGDPQAFAATLASLADSGKAAQVQTPLISMRDFEKVLVRARPTVSTKDLDTHINFTKEFGEEG